jgi:hypothetical protein
MIVVVLRTGRGAPGVPLHPQENLKSGELWVFWQEKQGVFKLERGISRRKSGKTSARGN